MNDLQRYRRIRQETEFIVTGAKIYEGGTVEIVRRGTPLPAGGTPKRSVITEYSQRSRLRLYFVSRETKVKFGSMMTLSYGISYPTNGKRVKQHLNRFLVFYRREFGGEYIWWLEFQRRGAPHIHLLSELAEISTVDRKVMAHNWVRAQDLPRACEYSCTESREVKNLSDQVYKVHSHHRQWQQNKQEDGGIRYIAKYALKTRQKAVPANYRDVGRFWGASRGVSSSIPSPVVVELSEADVMDALFTSEHWGRFWDKLPKVIFGAGDAVKDQVSKVDIIRTGNLTKLLDRDKFASKFDVFIYQ